MIENIETGIQENKTRKCKPKKYMQEITGGGQLRKE